MRKLLSLLGAAVSFAACSNPTAPDVNARAIETAKAKAALGAIATPAPAKPGRMAAN